ncbi:hypothetical protein SAMN05518672_10442 [Chitinophaga sp. CF118]|nr:hypothetical protein SAMN05518672_10442 [Chitinophaga sp. CF118]
MFEIPRAKKIRSRSAVNPIQLKDSKPFFSGRSANGIRKSAATQLQSSQLKLTECFLNR